jgi:quercetin dioxygenase-like cupin family protein
MRIGIETLAAEFEPGGEHKLHRHPNCEQATFLLSGSIRRWEFQRRVRSARIVRTVIIPLPP